MTSTDKDLVFLAPTVPADEDRVLRVHQGILCEASSYFATLLKSDFAEASDLRQKQQLCSAISSSLNLSSSPTEACRKQLGVNTSQTPTVKVDDITYAQLQTVLFFIFTGEAVFERRPCNYEASTDTRSNDSWTASDENACPSYWETPVRSTASLVESNLAWWDGQLEPANAFDMFRIADKYCIDGLRSAALQHIAKDISKSTLKTDLEEREEIIMFPEICEVYRNFCKVWYLALGSELDKHIEDTLGLDVSELANAVPLSIESLYFED
ncbi:related to vacuolar protein sorting protein VpsB [Sporisorium scitamineum]|uniref:Related to vacuolar protein sorting protein VpsB n=2 Tax=Sporisorium scitamineum TaxID=49012 RepID=A0A127Z854_9BASI|nr:related to vacuolar protein sorting protein VpsB [Sporisorium scitamineum]